MNEIWIYLLLFLTSLAAGFVDSIAGGGGLITLPALLMAGVPPQLALGTNKLQSSFGSASATRVYLRAGAIRGGGWGWGLVCVCAAAGAGACAVQRLPASLLRSIIPWLLASILVCLFLKPDLGHREAKPKLSPGLFYLVFGLGLGFYDGFFGPGTGTFWAMAYVLVLGYDLTRATAHTKLMNFGSNAGSLIFFMLGGKVLYGTGLVMAAGQFVGGRAGARMVVARGARFIRPVLLSVAFIMTAKLFWDRFRG
jgi:uncharacterized membrane protein YfcA